MGGVVGKFHSSIGRTDAFMDKTVGDQREGVPRALVQRDVSLRGCLTEGAWTPRLTQLLPLVVGGVTQDHSRRDSVLS